MQLATKNGSLIVKNGSVAENCNCCDNGTGICCKADRHCTNVKASECPESVGVWTSPQYGIVCPPSGCCCGPSRYQLDKWPNCLEGGCRPEQIDVSFSFSAPQKIFGQYVVIGDVYYYWQHSAVTFSGSVTLVRYPEHLPDQPNSVLYYFAHDPSGTAGSDLGLGQGFANASASSVVLNAANMTAQFYFERKAISTSLTQMESCNDYLFDPGVVVHGRTAGYGTVTTDTTPYNGGNGSGFLNEYVQWTANLALSEMQINSNCLCYGSGTSASSSTEKSFIDYSVLALQCDQRPSVINQETRALDALSTSTVTGAATLTINDAR